MPLSFACRQSAPRWALAAVLMSPVCHAQASTAEPAAAANSDPARVPADVPAARATSATATAPAVGSEAVPAPAPVAVADAPDGCSAGRWKLTGASAEPGASTAFVAAWDEQLKDVVRCLELPEQVRTCVAVQGHFDGKKFESRAVARAFGSDEAAQMVRAHGRAGVVTSHLYELGVGPERLKVVPPGTHRSWRGALLTLQADCLPPPVSDKPVVAVDDSSSNNRNGGSVVVINAAPTKEEGDSLLSLSLYFGHSADFAHSTDWDYSAITKLGASFQPGPIYVDIGIGMGLSPEDLARVSSDIRINAGYRQFLDDRVRVGVAGGYRRSGRGVLDAWMVREWWVGVHSAQCHSLDGKALTGEENIWAVCAQETIAPYGDRAVRGAIVSDELFILPQETEYRFGFELGLRLEVKL